MSNRLMVGYMDQGHGHGHYRVCTPDGKPLEMTGETVERIVNLWNSADTSKEELVERNRMLIDIMLSAVALKMNIENDFPPSLHALNRDLGLFQRRFGGVIEMVGKAAVAMDENGDVAQVVEHSPDKGEAGSSSDSVTTNSESELEQQLRKENDLMRKLIAKSDIDCVYCGLPKADMAKCERGFPGCGRADDMMI